MKNEIICPDIEKLGKKHKGKLNFSLARCAERRKQGASGCKGCLTGLSWATKYYIWWPMWNKEKQNANGGKGV